MSGSIGEECSSILIVLGRKQLVVGKANKI